MARPRKFQEKEVLTKVMHLFWEKGFRGTSLEDLVSVSGLNKGSLYGSFGNKEKLFRLAIEHYFSDGPFSVRKTGSPVEALCDYFSRVVSEADLPKKQRRGCFIFNSCLEFGTKSSRLTPYVISLSQKREKFFQGLIDEAQEKGEIPSSVDSKRAAQRVFAAAFTIREMVKFKPDREFLCEIANTALGSLGTERRVV